MKADLAKIPKRNVVKSEKKLDGILSNGADNAYPTRMERLINSSVTAKNAAKMYASFLVGDGFQDETLNDIIVGKSMYRDVTMYDLLEKVAASLSYQSGSFLHLAYNGNLKIDSVTPLQYKNCRLGKPDGTDYSPKIIYYNNWDKSTGKNILSKDFIDFNLFNSDENVIKYQIAKAGGDIEKWTGQVANLFLNDEYIYPLSPIDVAQDDADTEYQIAMFKNGELSRNFFAKYFLKHAYFADAYEKQAFIKSIEEFTGAENNGAIMVVNGDIRTEGSEIIDDTFKLEKVEQNINDKLFVDWEKSIPNNIRKAWDVPKLLIDPPEGVFGSSGGAAFKEAALFYNHLTKRDRAKISNFLKEIFKNFKTPIISDFEIQPLIFDFTTPENNA